MCRTFLLNGSPNPDGHSMRLAMAVLAGLPGECETVDLYQCTIMPCLDCGCCSSGQPCPIADDMPELTALVKSVDLLLIASPLHFTSLTAPLISFYSRLQPLWQASRRGEHSLASRVKAAGLALTGGGEYTAMFEPARTVTAAVCVSLGIAVAGMATAKHTDTTPIADNPDALASAATLAGKMRGYLRQ